MKENTIVRMLLILMQVIREDRNLRQSDPGKAAMLEFHLKGILVLLGYDPDAKITKGDEK